MTTRSFIAILGAAILASAAVAAAEPQVFLPATPLEQFEAAVREYALLHRALEQQEPPLRAGTDAHAIAESADAVASALQRSRTHAREGDIFTAAVGALLRTHIAAALDAHDVLPEEVVASSVEEADETTPLPVVNGRFSFGRGAMMWPCVIDALPRLPRELQYRMVGRDLVLVDTHAELVVDILRDAVR